MNSRGGRPWVCAVRSAQRACVSPETDIASVYCARLASCRSGSVCVRVYAKAKAAVLSRASNAPHWQHWLYNCPQPPMPAVAPVLCTQIQIRLQVGSSGADRRIGIPTAARGPQQHAVQRAEHYRPRVLYSPSDRRPCVHVPPLLALSAASGKDGQHFRGVNAVRPV
jgi:hypothetical protein